MALCDECRYNIFDEESEEYYCDLALDEDEYVRFLEENSKGKPCRYFIKDLGEYGIVRKQN